MYFKCFVCVVLSSAVFQSGYSTEVKKFAIGKICDSFGFFDNDILNNLISCHDEIFVGMVRTKPQRTQANRGMVDSDKEE